MADRHPRRDLHTPVRKEVFSERGGRSMSRMSFPDEVGCSSQMKSTWPSVLTGRSSVVYRVQSRFRLAQMDRPPAGSCAPASTPRPARRVLADGGTSRSWTYASVHRRRWPSSLTASSSVTATSVTSSSGGRVHGNPVSLPTSPLPRDRCCPRTSTTRSSPAATRRTDAPRLVGVTCPELSGAGPLTPSNGAGYAPGRGIVGGGAAMVDAVGVHGISQQQGGPTELLRAWNDGLGAAPASRPAPRPWTSVTTATCCCRTGRRTPRSRRRPRGRR
jgi:hypothetical protein